MSTHEGPRSGPGRNPVCYDLMHRCAHTTYTSNAYKTHFVVLPRLRGGLAGLSHARLPSNCTLGSWNIDAVLRHASARRRQLSTRGRRSFCFLDLCPHCCVCRVPCCPTSKKTLVAFPLKDYPGTLVYAFKISTVGRVVLRERPRGPQRLGSRSSLLHNASKIHLVIPCHSAASGAPALRVFLLHGHVVQ